MKTKFNPNNYKAVLKKLALLFLLFTAIITANAERTITGMVTDATDNTPLIGVSVRVDGTTKGTITDIDGKYSLNVADQGVMLLFSFIGYEISKIKVNSENIINVQLVQSKTSLDEVIVVGYGVCSQKIVTGAVSTLRIKKSGKNSSPKYFNPSEESYSKINENVFRNVATNPLSTFSVDVDRASYANVRRYIEQGTIPPADAVRIEELINYFNYNYPGPEDEHPVSMNTEYTTCPWKTEHKLLRIGLQGKKIATENLPPSNLVFLIDVSGSMDEPNKLPLVKSAFRLLTNNLRSIDKVAIVVYAGAAGVVLPSTPGNEKDKILYALNSLNAGGSTAGCQGIEMAYKIAAENFIDGGNNRVILATDGDFNVGISADNELEDFIMEKRKDGTFLTCLGFGMGNYKDSKIEILADKGNGNYAYIYDMEEANKVFVNEFGGTLFTIAKDVKIQIEFNPELVQAYRLLGYENRLLNNEDFKDDTKDAGEMGAGHTVTALYEIIPVGVKSKFVPDVDKLKYQKQKSPASAMSDEVATVKFRYKKPNGLKSIELVTPILSNSIPFDQSSENTRFAASVAMFGMLLTDSKFKGSTTFPDVLNIVKASRGSDDEGYRGEFVKLVNTASNLEIKATIEE
jgi:Ca-activated chloride channel homolog